MPIEIRLLRPSDEGGIVEEVIQWQELRKPVSCRKTAISNDGCSISESTTRKLISTIQLTDDKRRCAVRDLNRYRGRLNFLQRALAPPKPGAKHHREDSVGTFLPQYRSENDSKWVEGEVDVATLRGEVRGLRFDTIPGLEAKVAEFSHTLETHLMPRLGNVVDLKPFNDGDLKPFNDGVPCGNDFSSLCRSARGVKEKKDTPEFPSTTRISSKWYVNHDQNDILDPLFCLGGYEKVPGVLAEVAVHDRREKAVLTGVGSSLARALPSCAISFLNRRTSVIGQGSNLRQGKYDLCHLPASLHLSNQMAHSVMGCRAGSSSHSCPVCGSPDFVGKEVGETTVSVPPYLTLSAMHQNRSYSDRQLPLRYLCTTASSDSLPSEESTWTFSKRKSNARSSIKFTHPMERVEFFGLTTCNMAASRCLQDDMVRAAMDFHLSLLLCNIDSNSSPDWKESTANVEIVRARTLSPPCNLQPNEARRVVIEGYIFSSRDYCTLGHVSNFTDFVSRGFRTKYAGGGVGAAGDQANEYVHTVHGILCDVEVTMEWLVKNNVVAVRPDEKLRDILGVGIPLDLARFMHLDLLINEKCAAEASMGALSTDLLSPLVPQTKEQTPHFVHMPFKRRLLHGKHGRFVVKDISSMSHPTVVSFRCRGKERCNGNCHPVGKQNQHSVEVKSSSNKKGQIQPDEMSFLPLLVDQSPSSEDLKREAMCNPYDFLPFLYDK